MKYIFLAINLFLILASSVVAASDKTSQAHHFSEVAASGNDWLISKGQNNSLLMPFTWITSRGLSTVLFPVCTAIDMTLLTAEQVGGVLSNFIGQALRSTWTTPSAVSRKHPRAEEKDTRATCPLHLVFYRQISWHIILFQRIFQRQISLQVVSFTVRVLMSCVLIALPMFKRSY